MATSVLSRVAGLFVLGALAACAPDVDAGPPTGANVAPLFADRCVHLEEVASMQDESRVCAGDASFNAFLGTIARGAAEQVGMRFATHAPCVPLSEGCSFGSVPVSPAEAAGQAQMSLFMAHQMMMLAEAVTIMEVHLDGRVVQQDPRDLSSASSAAYVIRGPLMRDAKKRVESRDTFARIAIELARLGAYFASTALGPTNTGALSHMVSSNPQPADDSGVFGPTVTEGPSTVDLGFVIASTMAECAGLLQEAASLVEENTTSYVRARSRLDARTIRENWRGPKLSLLDVASVWMGVPEHRFEPTDESADTSAAFPVVDHVAETKDDERAERIIRTLGVDPRLPRALLYETLEKANMRDNGTSLPRGLSPPVLELAAKRILAQARMAGSPILADRGRDAIVPRVTGTETAASPEPAYLAAMTSGAFADATSSTHGPSLTYARRGVLPTLDWVATEMANALSRPDLSAHAKDIMLASIMEIRARVPGRFTVAVGQLGDAEGVDRVRIRAYPDCADCEAWWGEAGLQCALHGRVNGDVCTEREHRLATPVLRDRAYRSGISQRYSEWNLAPNDVVPQALTSSGYIRFNDRIYITKRREGARIAVGAMVLDAGPSSSAVFSRVTQIPWGIDQLSSVLTPSEGFVELPSLCLGIPEEQAVPVSDDFDYERILSEAGEAARQADGLGETLIEQGLGMDLRAEAARDELEEICGGVLNVSDLPLGAAGRCDADSDCTSSNSALRCIGFDPARPTELGNCLPRVSDLAPDSSGVAQCLGPEPGEDLLVHAALGTEPVCMWQARNPNDRTQYLPPCVCPDGWRCPECPALLPNTARGPDENPCTNAFPSNLAFIVSFRVLPPTETMGMFDSSPTGVTDMPDCVRLAKLRSGEESALADVRAQAWLTQTSAQNLVAAIGFRHDMLQFARVTRNGQPWIATGSDERGPTTPGEFPCGPHPLLASLETEERDRLCSDAAPAGKSLLCGGFCGNAGGRVPLNRRLFDAVTTLAVMSGRDRASMRSGPAMITMPAYWHYMDVNDRPLAVPYVESFAYWRGLGRARGNATIVAEPPLSEDDRAQWVLSRWMESLDYPRQYIGGTWFPDPYRWREVSGAFPSDPNPASMPEYQDAVFPPWLSTYATLPDGNYPEGRMVSAQHNNGANGVRGVREKCISSDDDLGTSSELKQTVAVGETCELLYDEAAADEVHGIRTIRDLDPLARHWTLQDRDEDGVAGLVWEILRQASRGDAQRAAPLPTWLTDNFRFPNMAPTKGTYLDALELLCLTAHAEDQITCSDDIAAIPEVNSVGDFRLVENRVSCVADRVSREAGRLALMNVPESVVRDVNSSGFYSTYPEQRGQYGEVITLLQSELVAVGSAPRHLAVTLGDLNDSLRMARSQLHYLDLQEYIDERQFSLRIVAEAARCVSSIVGAITATIGNRDAISKAVFTCADAAIQIESILQIQEWRESQLGEQQRQVLIEVMTQTRHAVASVGAAADEIQTRWNNVSAKLIELENLRERARRATARMMLLDRDDVGREYAVNRVMRARMNHTKKRYEEARRRAIDYAWLAKLAIEQHFVVDLESMTTSTAVGDGTPPAEWVNSLCLLGGTDYSGVRDVNDDAADGSEHIESLISYVERLKDFTRSYGLYSPHEQARGIAVLSMRDDIGQRNEWGGVPLRGIVSGCDGEGTGGCQQIDFDIDIDAIESATPTSAVGLAEGNYNYRIERIAVMLVMPEPAPPSDNPAEVCGDNSYFEYSLQNSISRAKDYEGEPQDLSIFGGEVIRHARGGIIGRFGPNHPLNDVGLRNPIDPEIYAYIETSFFRHEVRNRPLEGAYTLRIYNSDCLDLSNLGDIKLVVDYTYWTSLR